MSIKKLARKLWTGRSSREVQQSLFRRRPLFEALERRYLMSAELVPPPPPPAGEQAPVTMPAQPGQAGPQAKKTSAPGASLPGRARRLPEAGRAGRTDFAGSVRQGQRRAPGRRQGLAAGPGGRPARAPDRHRGLHHAVRAHAGAPDHLRGSVHRQRRADGPGAVQPGQRQDRRTGRTGRPTGEGPQLQVLRSHDTEIIVLDGRYDGVDQITRILGQHRTWRPCRS